MSKVLVVGSVRGIENPEQVQSAHEAGAAIGKRLAERGHTILVGSEDPQDIDPDVVRGAVSSGKATSIEVHLMRGAPECYRELSQEGKVRNRPHRYRDWDVTVLEVLRHDADAVIALGGRVGVIQTGIAAWMLGRAVLPIAALGGGAQTVWGYGSGERSEFYFGALTDEEIDRLTSAWDSGGKGTSADFVVAATERLVSRARQAKTPKSLFFLVSILVLLALVCWVSLLVAPLPPVFGTFLQQKSGPNSMPGVRFVLLLISICAAGGLGALMQTLRGMRENRPVTLQRIIADAVLGIAAGFLTAALYLIAQVAVTGKLDLPQSNEDYTRIALIVGLAALFSSLYLDAALARFDSLKESVMAGKYGVATRDKS